MSDRVHLAVPGIVYSGAMSEPDAPTPSTGEEIAGALRHPALQIGLSIWAAAAVWVWSVGIGMSISIRVLQLLGVGLFALLTIALTAPVEDDAPAGRIRWQLGALAAVVLLTGYGGFLFHGVLDTPSVPVWSELGEVFARAGLAALPPELVGVPAHAGKNFGQYVMLPLAVLLLLGARPRGLGFRAGHRTVRVALLWCAIPLAVIGVRLATGGLATDALLRQMGSHFFQNSFSEEFLFRGAIQTRLEPLFGRGWALLAQALLFGVWHLGAMTPEATAGGIVAGLAGAVVVQATMGLAFGVIFLRTRSVVAPTAVHVLSNMIG